MNVAIIETGAVARIVVVADGDSATIAALGGVALSDNSPVGIGWNYDGTTFAAPTKPLAEAKADKVREIQTMRDAACCASVTAHGRIWQADKRSQELLGRAITLAHAGLPLPAVWRDAANSDMPVTALADLLAIAGAIATQTQTAYAHSWALKAQIAAATNVEQVEAVTW